MNDNSKKKIFGFRYLHTIHPKSFPLKYALGTDSASLQYYNIIDSTVNFENITNEYKLTNKIQKW